MADHEKGRVKGYLPSNERSPHAIQITKLMPTEPVLTSKPLGDTKIPEPKAWVGKEERKWS
jgi:hypothetical protein